MVLTLHPFSRFILLDSEAAFSGPFLSKREAAGDPARYLIVLPVPFGQGFSEKKKDKSP